MQTRQGRQVAFNSRDTGRRKRYQNMPAVLEAKEKESKKKREAERDQ
jgi:hypothetical protein